MAKGAMAMECPRCGGEMQFDPTLGKLKCIYCDSAFTAEEVEAIFAEKEKKTKENSSGEEQGGINDMNAYTCSNCGAELMTDANTAVIRCPYCGNSTVAPSQFEGVLRPEYIIPFGFTKEQLINSYKAFYQKKWFVPKSFINNNEINEIQGVYVPFWLYSGNAEIEAEYEGRNVKENDNEKITDYYSVSRKGKMSFENVPADASKRMDDALMDSIEPYNYDAVQKFSITYLPGFLAEKYDVTADENRQRTHDRVKGTISHKTKQTAKYDEVDVEKENIKVDFDKEKYALLPVWYFVSKWDDKDFVFAMNGQTGKIKGDLPADKMKIILAALIAFLIPFLILWLAVDSLAAGIIVGLIVGGITAAAAFGSTKSVAEASDANEYIKDDLELTYKNDMFIRQEKEKKEKE